MLCKLNFDAVACMALLAFARYSAFARISRTGRLTGAYSKEMWYEKE